MHVGILILLLLAAFSLSFLPRAGLSLPIP